MNAIEQISQLRESVTQMPSGEEKRLVYATIFQMARDAGYFTRMMEVAPFAGIVASRDDLEKCADVARTNKDLRSFVMALRTIKRSPTLQELVAFINDVEGGDGPALLKIIGIHIPPHRLSYNEWMTIENLRALISDTSS